jgi:hypothetical protein
MIVAAFAAFVTGGAVLAAMGHGFGAAGFAAAVKAGELGALALAGAAGGFASGLIATGSLKGAFRGALYGGVSAMFAGAIGAAVHDGSMAAAFGDFADLAANTFHGLSQGLVSEAFGGDFKSGFIGAFVGHSIGGTLRKIMPKTLVGRTIAAAVTGGISSRLGGGKFANGAVSAAFAHLFNNEAKKWSFEKLKDSYQTKGELMPNLENSKFPRWAIDAIDASDGGSCATRMSNAFNRAGYGDFIEGAPRRFGDGSGNYYVLGAAELADHIGVASSKYLVTDLSSISGKTGIIYFENYHIDLYDGSSMVGNRGYTEQYFNKKSTYFMEVK